jgi:transposase
MYLDSCTTKGKYKRHLLRETFRENGKVKHRTIANLSKCSEEEVAAIRLALKHKNDLTALGSISETVSLRQGLSVGSVWLVYDLARQLGIAKALGPSANGKLALWQVIARVIDQGSRLSAVRLAQSHAACDILSMDGFNEDKLYKNLAWLSDNQLRIEDRLFKALHPDHKPGLYLYDVTSSYLEGSKNELAAFGYNRDRKKGKRQIVIGLLCDQDGKPLSIEVFAGNTQDPATMASQIKKAAGRFGGGQVTFVGDRGMIKSQQVKDLAAEGFHYITGITKPQIASLLAKGVIQLNLFDQELAEVKGDDGVRYIMRRNPIRAQEIQKSREDKFRYLQRQTEKQNQYLAGHQRAKPEVALRKISQLSQKLKLSKWVTPHVYARKISFLQDQPALKDIAKLDGCYVLITDLSKKEAGKETVHDRYKDLTLVERAFRTSKTAQLEMRPVHLRLASHTRGHALVVMLAYKIVQELAKRWKNIDLKVKEGIGQLGTLCATEMLVDGTPRCNTIPQPRQSVHQLLEAARVRLPKVLPCRGEKVATRKNLANRRNSS